MSDQATDEFKNYLIARAQDPDSGMTIKERALYSLISLPRAAQMVCSDAERETVTRNVMAAMAAAVDAALRHKS